MNGFEPTVHNRDVSRILSPDWRPSHLCWFKREGRGRKTFRPRPEQQTKYGRAHPAIAAHRRHREIKLKSRKRGIAKGCCFHCLDNTAYRKYSEAVTVGHEQKKAAETRVERLVPGLDKNRPAVERSFWKGLRAFSLRESHCLPDL
jgi:hypothetical protein